MKKEKEEPPILWDGNAVNRIIQNEYEHEFMEDTDGWDHTQFSNAAFSLYRVLIDDITDLNSEFTQRKQVITTMLSDLHEFRKVFER